MARPHPVTVLAFALLALAPAAAPAQSGLRTLHVDALSMRADRSALRVGDVFHLAIHVRVREDVAALDELVVPDVGTMQLLGDERRTTRAGTGTDVVETLTLEPTARGRFTFAPAYLDAIDARTHRPSRFSSNPVTVSVTVPGPLEGGRARLVRRTLVVVLAAVGVAALAVLLIALGRLRSRRRRAVVTVAPPVAAPPPPPTLSARDRVAAALRTYRVAPAGAALLALRAELFAAAAAPDGATLRDALAGTSDRALREALLAAERAAFGPAHVRDAASVELAHATEAWLR